MKKYIYIALLAVSCGKDNNRTTSEMLSGYWVELSFDKKLKDWSTHFHFTSSSSNFVAYDNPNHATFDQRHDNPIKYHYILNGDNITFVPDAYPDDLEDNGTISFIGNDTVKIVSRPDVLDPTYIPTVYWLRVND
ncbi:MAG: hypothetical protein U0T69_06570 [Chitinophagales bacterium]